MTACLPYHGLMAKQPRDEAFIMSRVTIHESGCWQWNRFVHPKTGYGVTTRTGSSPMGAHVLAYEIFAGPVPFGFVVDHTCSNRMCCNPKHLECVTTAENNRRTAERGRCANQNTYKDVCPKCGGEYEFIIRPARPKGFRRCPSCHRKNRREYERAQRAQKRGD